MKASKNCLDLIKRFEGFKSSPYICAGGKITIGIGSTYYADGKPVAMTDKPITLEQAETILVANLNTYEECVNFLVKTPLTQNQYDALISFAYNLGCGNFKTSTLLKLINLNPNHPMIQANFLKWCKAGGKTLKGLLIRRQVEWNLYNKK